MSEEYRIQGFTDLGVRYSNNQDTYWVAELEVDNSKATVIAICDGMGGLEDGSYASQLVISEIRNSILGGNLSSESIREAIQKANDIIFGKYSGLGKQCGTTCSVVVLQEGNYWGYHIGDSRIYQLRGSNYKILTEDHTLLNVRRKKGIKITPEDQRKYRSTISRCIGVIARPRIDFLEGTYEIGDTFVVCSDGFWHYWDIRLDNLKASIERVKSLGERDNITVAAVSIDESK